MMKWNDVVINQFGGVVKGASVTVKNTGLQTSPTIYSDNGTSTVASSTVTADSLGRYSFYVAAGRYDLNISGAGITAYTESDILIFDPHDTSDGAAYLAFLQSGTGGISRDVQTILRNIVWTDGFNLLPSNSAADNNTALGNIATKLNALGGATLIIPPGTYNVTGTDAGVLCSLQNLIGLHIIAPGATFTDGTTYTGTQAAEFLRLTACSNVKVTLRGTSQVAVTTSVSNARGLYWLTLKQGCSDVEVDIDVTGGLGGLRALKLSSDPASYDSRGLRGRVKCSGVYYPYSGQYSGSDADLQIDADTCGRNFYFYAINNQRLRVRSKNQQNTSLIAAFTGLGCSDVKIDAYDRDSDTGQSSAPFMSLLWGDSTAASHRNIDIRVDVKNPSGAPFSNTLSFVKISDGGSTPDVTGRGHLLDGFRLSGISDQTSCAKNHVDMTTGAWAASDVVRNFRVDDLTMLGTAEAANFHLEVLADEALFTNVRSQHNIYTGNTTNGKVVFVGCRALNFSALIGNTDTHDYYSCNITDASSQNTANNKRFVNTIRAGTLYGVGNYADSNANVLDYYQEGTWTPTLAFGGAAVGMTYSIQDGSYTRIGNRVSATFRIVLTAKGSSVGNATVSGLPFTAAATPNGGASVTIATNFTLTGALSGYVGAGTAVLNVTQSGAAGYAAVTDAAFANNNNFQMSCSYEV